MAKSSRAKRKRISKQSLLLVFLLLLILGSGAYFLWPKKDPSNSTPQTQDTSPDTYINLDPPTEQEKQEAAARKETGITDTPPQNSSDGKQIVTPIITSASQTELRAFVSGVAEDGGTCTATFTKGSTSFVKTSPGFMNVSSTNCELITLQRSDFANTGTWSVIVSYSSDKAAGTSQATNIEVQ